MVLSPYITTSVSLSQGVTVWKKVGGCSNIGIKEKKSDA